MNNISQSDLIKQYNDQFRPKFNEEFFTRSEDEIIEELKNVILSFQKFEGPYTLRVDSFEVVKDYNEVMTILSNYEEKANEGPKRKKRINKYKYINLKDSDIVLLIVNYYMAINNEKNPSSTLKVYIAVPKIVNKYYFRISGNLYSAVLQITEGSTYNNASSSSKKETNITLRTISNMCIRIYKNQYKLINSNGLEVPCVYFATNVFSKSVGGFKYILAKYGFYKTLEMSGIGNIRLSNNPSENETDYSFYKNNIYIIVPKYLFDNNEMLQSLVFTIYHAITNEVKLEDLFLNSFWIDSLGRDFKSEVKDKGYYILSSLEGIYDLSTKNSIRLPEKDKESIYSILLWMMGEFNALKTRNNLDISTYRIRYGEYLASLYAAMFSKGIYRLSDAANKVKLSTIKKVINKRPTKLLEEICKCSLVNYRNLVNDNDAITALKYTFNKAETDKSKISPECRMMHPSHLGRIDPDSSTKSDPGRSGVLCPLGKLYDGSFSDFEEPNSWKDNYSELLSNYKSIVGLKEVLIFKRDVLGIPDEGNQLQGLNESIDIMNKLVCPITRIAQDVNQQINTEVLEEGGLITYEHE